MEPKSLQTFTIVVIMEMIIIYFVREKLCAWEEKCQNKRQKSDQSPTNQPNQPSKLDQ